jgi:hypothetical protein
MPDVGPDLRRGISSILDVVSLVLIKDVSVGFVVGAVAGHSIKL